MQSYLKWDSEADFNTWHNTVCFALGYPNAETMTHSYTKFQKHPLNNTGICAVLPGITEDLLLGKALLPLSDVTEYFTPHTGGL